MMRSRKRPVLVSLIVYITLSAFMLAGFFVITRGVQDLSLSLQAQGWPTAQGRITRSELTEDDGSSGIAVEYTYVVDEQTLVGNTVAFGDLQLYGDRFHRDVRSALPLGAPVAVRYDPRDPKRSVLASGFHHHHLSRILFGLVFVIMSSGFLVIFMRGGGANELVRTVVVYSEG